MPRAALLLALLTIPAPLSAQLRTWCMDGWAGELCFDVLTFQLTEETFTLGGQWYGAGYPVGNFDHHGRGPFFDVGFFDSGSTMAFLDWQTQSGALTNIARSFPVPGGRLESVSSLDDISYLAFGARRTAIPDPIATAEERKWDNAGCYVPGWQGNGYNPSGQFCREPVSVPEPSSLLLLATGLVGLGYGYRGRRRA